MSNPTPAQEEFARIVNGADETSLPHPEDRLEEALNNREDPTEEDEYRNAQISAAMRMPTSGGRLSELKLPPASFDSGRSTGVKGVIADARSYEAARRSRFKDAVRTARRSVLGADEATRLKGSDSETDGDMSSDEEAFLRQWRESRRRELENEMKSGVRNRRTSPSVRLFGRFDEVDALGYLDAIEKVGRDTVVVVFVHDREVGLSPPSSSPRPRFSRLMTAVRGLRGDRVRPDPPRIALPGRALRQGPLR